MELSMKKNLLVLVLVSVIAGTQVLSSQAFAQNMADTTHGWRTGGQFGINLTNVGFTNWAAGGQNTLAATALLTAFANFRGADLMDFWDNGVEAAYGVARVGVTSNPFRKSDDRFLLFSKYTHKLEPSSSFGYSGLLDFRTQFVDGFDYTKTPEIFTSTLFAPAFINLAIGIDFKPNDSFSLFLSPIGGRVVIVGNRQLADGGAFGVERGQTSRADFGATFTVFWKQPIMENITFQTRLNLFSAYRNITAVVVNWETLTLLKVNKYINVSFDTQLIYDDKIPVNRDNGMVGPATQFRNTLAVGFVLGL
jgi:hypothetical protein